MKRIAMVAALVVLGCGEEGGFECDFSLREAGEYFLSFDVVDGEDCGQDGGTKGLGSGTPLYEPNAFTLMDCDQDQVLSPNQCQLTTHTSCESGTLMLLVSQKSVQEDEAADVITGSAHYILSGEAGEIFRECRYNIMAVRISGGAEP